MIFKKILLCGAMLGLVCAFTSCDKNEDIFDAPQVINPVNEVKEPQTSELRAASGNFIEPEGWTLVEDLGNEYGYKLYKNKDDDYVQKVNLSMGAHLSVGFGTPSVANPEIPASPLFKRIFLSKFWKEKNSKAISAVNCSFFGYDKKPKNIVHCAFSFPIKVNGKIYSVGSYPDAIAKRILILNRGSALVKTFSLTTNNEREVEKALSRYSIAICGYSPDADFGPLASWRKTGRTMIGVYDQNGDGRNEVIYILSGDYLQSSAKQVLIDFGCKSENIVMFDGSDSAQMIMENPIDRKRSHSFQKDARTIPNVLYVLCPGRD